MSDFPKENDLSAEELELFEYLLEEEGVAEASPAQAIPRRERGEDAPLSFAQQRLWFLDQLRPGGAAYNTAGAVWLDGDLDAGALARSLEEIVRRHESLRTTFSAEGGRPVQVVRPSPGLPLPLVDLAPLPEAEREARARRLAREEAARPFDLARGPVMRATLVRLSPRRHLLLVAIHHIASDGWSVGVLVRELRALYTAFSRGEASPLAELPVQYADFAVWQRERLRGERLDEQLRYWRRQLGGESGATRLPFDRRPGASAARPGAEERLSVGREVTRGLRELGRGEGATLFMVLLAVWKVLLWRYGGGGAGDVSVGTPVAGRDREELEPLIGFFVNTLVMRTDLGGEPSFRELLGRVREVCLGAYAHQDAPFEMLVEELRPERGVSEAALFQTLFSMQNAPRPEFEMAGLRARVEEAPSGAAKFDLSLEVIEDGEELVCVLEYDAGLFEAATIGRMAAHFRTLLEGVVADPDAGIHELPLLAEGERRRLLAACDDTRVAYPRGELLHELFEAQAARTPDAVAVVYEGGRLSYAELNRSANRLAHHLRRRGLRPEARIGVLLERSPEMVVALLAVLKAGGACVPLDPSYPPERLRLMLEDSAAALLLTRGELSKGLGGGGWWVVCLDALEQDLRGEGARDPERVGEAEGVAYVIYTSGSTGRPKGVMVTHGALCNHMRWMRDWFGFDAADKVLQKTPVGFDASVWEFYAPLAAGARLVLARPGGQQDSSYLARAVIEHGVTVLQVVPTLLRMLIGEPDFGRCESLRLVFCGGEALGEELAARCRSRLPRARLCNLYGPAEATIDATFWEYDGARGAATVPIGRPVANVTAYVLDRRLNVVPEGVAGELYLGGAGLARGYQGRAGLTAERFTPHPYASEPGERLYRTGDAARRLAGGELEFLGREDGQVKVRGSRVELGEIEAALCEHVWVRAAAVTAREDASGELRLAAYVVAEQEEPGRVTAELRERLKARLPAHMLPSAFVLLGELPLLPSGKVDRRRLPEPCEWGQGEAVGRVAPPRTPVEELLCGVWSQLLGTGRVGVHDNFFDLGGHSLLATQVVSRVREALSVELPLGRLFQTPTIAGLAEFVEQELRGGGVRAAPPLRPAPRGGALPLSFAQQRLWFLDQLEPGNPLYNTPGALRLKGRLDVPALEWALSEIVRRHEILRTTFDAPQGSPVQVISPPRPVRVPLIDLSGLDEDAREAEARRLMNAEARLPFDLAAGPLLRATLLRLGEEEHALLLTMHHVVSDGWSVGVLVREAAELYAAFRESRPASLEELRLQYADYAVWQREWLKGDVLEAQLAYWRKQLAGLPPALELPAARQRPKARSLQGASLAVELSEELTGGLKALGRREGVTLFMTLLAAFQTLLSRYAGQQDVAVGVPVANRGRREIEGLIGFFVNTLVMRTDLSGDPTFSELLRRVREVALGAYAHQDAPFEMLVEELQPERSLSHTPLFQALFVLQNAPAAAPELPGLEVEQLEVGSGTAKFDLMLSLEESEGSLRGVFEYSTDLFDEPSARRMLGHFETLLEGVARRPESRISELPLLGAEEERQLLVGWNQTAADFPRGRCVQDLFAEQAARTPDETALVFDGERLSYRELNERANRLARFLRRSGVGPETVVAVATGRSTLMAVGVLGTLKAGGAYLPLDPSYPRERLAFMLEDARVRVVLTERQLAARLPPNDARVVRLDAEWEQVARENSHDPEHGATDENLAYVIYTSGSTGRPKAVAMAHRALCNLVAFQSRSSSGGGGRPRTLQFASLNFDVSFQEMFSTWCAGATLVLVGDETRRDAGELLRVLDAERVERLFLPFVALQHLAEASEAEGFAPRRLREVITAGEQLKITPHVERLFGRLGGCVLDNHYGPTETHLATMWRLRGAAERWPKLPPIGEPVSNVQVYVLDERGRHVPVGVVGELYIGGEGLARGYLRRPALTAERFVPHPFSPEPGARLYRTGDLARRLADGRLEYVGRGDRQVKVRGFRVEVGEVEATLKLHAAVRQAAVTDWEDEAGRKRLAAYVVAAPDAPQTLTGELKRLLRERLPEYMMPSAFVLLGELPLTPSGKVDRRRLPEPCEWGQGEGGGRVAPPRTPVEELLCGVWGEVLGRAGVGADDDFFELGGHSLLATQLMSRVRRTFQVEVALRLLFERPTPARLAEVVEAEMRAGREPLPPVRPAPRGRSAPLSFAQQRLWFLDRLEPESAAYNLPSALRVRGPLDAAALERSLDEIVRRHEVLRTTFAIEDGEPRQFVAPHAGLRLPLIDLSELSEPEREAEAGRLTAEEARLPFDLGAGPLLRATLLRLGEEEHALLLTMHHVVSDGWSVGVLVRELRALYEAFTRGGESPLGELAVQYADYAVWQREHLRGERLEAQLAYWRKQLAGLPPALELPADSPRPKVRSLRGASVSVELSEELTGGLKALGRREGATLYMTLLAAFQLLLHRYTGRRDVVVGVPVANRNREELEGLVGFFVNTLVMRTDLSGDPTFRELLGRVKEVALGAYAHQDAPFEMLVEELQPERSLSHTPLFQALFALQNAPAYELALPRLELSVSEVENPAARFELALEVSEAGGGLDCRFTYEADLFDAATIERMAGHFRNLLRAVAADAGRRVSAVELLGEDERRRLLFDWSGARADFPEDLCAHELFEAQAGRTPEAEAVVCGAQRLSYRELNERANQCARLLRSLGAGPEAPVGICVERSAEMVVGLLGILKAGAAYVPISPGSPPERLGAMLEGAGVGLLLTQRRLAASLPAGVARVVRLDGDRGLFERESGDNLARAADPGNLAYVIHTSGSTGSPKGVAVTHRNLVHSTSARFVYYDEPVRGFMLVSPFVFDSSVAGIFWTLCRGGRLVLPAEEFQRDLNEFAALIEREGVSHLLCLPSLYALLLRQAAPAGRLGGLRSVIVAGEPCPPELPARHFEALPGAALFNEYGPTEGTVWASVYECAPRPYETSVPIGRPAPNVQVYVLDDVGGPAPVGVAGELYLGGEGLARGYLRRPALTAERFVPHPFSREPGARLYRTGDVARRRADGDLEFLGRRDEQVKVRGHRIELGEVEAALAAHPSVREAVVALGAEAAGDARLVGYVTAAAAEAPTADELRDFLRERLPEYMLPSAFVVLDALPLTASGKPDRRALPAPGPSRPALAAPYAAPQTPLEKAIAEVWREFLRLESIGVNDNFFELGGHSLMLVLVQERLRESHGRDVPVADLFRFPTVRALSLHLGHAPGRKDVEGESSPNRQRAGARQEALRARSRAKTGPGR
ncbi:MAG TPA: amino acid adenylation domain-containing protein [Pyrinomonadaceae bacterium]|jgi:amino acid adenylation domain-containing protein